MSRRMRHPEAVPAYVGRPPQPPAQRWIYTLRGPLAYERRNGGSTYAEAKERATAALAADRFDRFDHVWITRVE